MKADDAKGCASFERENARLKRIVADKELDRKAARWPTLASRESRVATTCIDTDSLRLVWPCKPPDELDPLRVVKGGGGSMHLDPLEHRREDGSSPGEPRWSPSARARSRGRKLGC
jgi:hypothetical protein